MCPNCTAAPYFCLVNHMLATPLCLFVLLALVLALSLTTAEAKLPSVPKNRVSKSAFIAAPVDLTTGVVEKTVAMSGGEIRTKFNTSVQFTYIKSHHSF